MSAYFHSYLCGRKAAEWLIDMKQGTLIYDPCLDRMDIRFGLNAYLGGLHCGECFDVWTGSQWEATRIERGEDWYLDGIAIQNLVGLRVRIKN